MTPRLYLSAGVSVAGRPKEREVLEKGLGRRSSILFFIVVVLLVGSATVAHAAVRQPAVHAKAWVLVDLRSGRYLAGRDQNLRLPMASTTKIMDALVALRAGHLNRKVTVSRRAAAYAKAPYSNAGLAAGERLTERELLEAALIPSADDAAFALAQALGGGSARRFVDEMNVEAGRLGLRETHFENPIGLDQKGHYTSARDLAKMTRVAWRYPLFRRIVGTARTTLRVGGREIPLVNTNELLFDYPGAEGVKTGTTPKAGECLVAAARRGDESYLVVLLDDDERFTDAVRLLDYAFARYDRRVLVRAGSSYASVKVPYRRGEKVKLFAGHDVSYTVDESDRIVRRIHVRKILPNAAHRGEKLGEIAVEVDGRTVGSSPLVAGRGYAAAHWWQKLWYTVQGIFG